MGVREKEGRDGRKGVEGRGGEGNGVEGEGGKERRGEGTGKGRRGGGRVEFGRGRVDQTIKKHWYYIKFVVDFFMLLPVFYNMLLSLCAS